MTAGDQIHGGAGEDTLKVSSNYENSYAGFEMDGVENLEVTADSTAELVFDLSGTEGLERVITKNSTGNVEFNRITTDASVMPLTVDVRNLTQDAECDC